MSLLILQSQSHSSANRLKKRVNKRVALVKLKKIQSVLWEVSYTPSAYYVQFCHKRAWMVVEFVSPSLIVQENVMTYNVIALMVLA